MTPGTKNQLILGLRCTGILFILLTLLPGPASAQTNAFIQTVAARFKQWDQNHDRKLSEQEVDAAIQDPTNTGPSAAALDALKTACSVADDDFLPLTLSQIRKRSNTNQYHLRDAYARCLTRIGSVTNRELFASGWPKIETIHQGRMGNCFTLAPLGSLVHRDPRAVASMFARQSNNSVLVKFPGGDIAVNLPTDAELGLTSGNSHDGVWVNLYEKAIGQARNLSQLPDSQSDLPIDAIARGGDASAVMSYLTGHKISRVSLMFGGENQINSKMAELRPVLAEASRQNRLITCGTGRVTTPGLTPTHAYALLAYHSDKDTVDLWNPYGKDFTPKSPPGLSNGFPTTNGLFTISVHDLVDQFDGVSVETGLPASRQWLDQWRALAEAGHFNEAADELTEVIKEDPTADWELYMLTPLLIQSGKMADYKTHCKTMLDQFEKTTIPSLAERTAKSCLLLPSAVAADDLVRAANLASNAVAFSKKGERLHWRLMTKGLARYRGGDYAGALETEPLSRDALEHERDLAGDACKADTYLIEAMARHQLHQTREARAAFNTARKIVRNDLPKPGSGDLGEAWFDDLMTYILMTEAKSTVEGAPTAKNK